MSTKSHFSSFDIFDTCLVRTCGTPENFFDVLSTRVFKHPVPENERQGFVIARRIIETKAYHNSPKSNIYDIYKEFSFKHSDILPNSELLEIELALEKEVLVPVLKVKETIDKLRDKGNQIMFISDMYLPAEFLSKILESFDIYKPGDKLFVSCDIGKTKFNGEIYRYIHNTEGIPYKKWTHYGDNERCDVKEPQKLGIKTVHIIHKYSTFEQGWIDKGNVTTFKKNHILAGISRALNYSLPEHPRKLLLLDIVAPLYASFVCSVFEDARKRNITSLYFCARDTYHMFQVAKVFNYLYPEIKIHYLKVSRKSLSNTDSETLIKFFEQEGLASTTLNTAIIDSSSTGGSHSIINNLLIKYNYKETFAYFLIKWREFDPLTNNASPVMRQLYINSKKNNTVFNRIKLVALIENVFSSNNQKSTIGYKVDNSHITPIYNEHIDNQDCFQNDIDNIQEYHKLLLTSFAKKYIDLGLCHFSFEILHNISIPSLCEFAYYPTKEYTESLKTCFLKENDIILPYVKKESLFRLIRTRAHDTCWSRATIFYNTPRWIHKHLLRYIDSKESL